MSKRLRRYTRSCYLPASVLARQGRCEMLAALEMRDGVTRTEEGERARAAGLAEHDRFHQQVVANHNRPAAKPSGGGLSPCFVASAVYGVDDARTHELRRFRDQVLLASGWTAWMVALYYAISPPVARWLQGRPVQAARVARVLDVLRTRMVRPLLTKGCNGQDGSE